MASNHVPRLSIVINDQIDSFLSVNQPETKGKRLITIMKTQFKKKKTHTPLILTGHDIPTTMHVIHKSV